MFLIPRGHGVGIEIHESRASAQGKPWLLARHGFVTIEPGIYMPGQFGIRIEDSAVTKLAGRS